MTRLHHRFDGPDDAPVLVLGPAIGTTMELWEPRLADLTATWRVLRYDLPGHGGSDVVHGTIGDLAGADDIATPLDHAETLAQGIPGAELVIVPGAAHLANLERPEPVTHAMLRHLERTP